MVERARPAPAKPVLTPHDLELSLELDLLEMRCARSARVLG
jgi:hypothetical protein